MIDHGQVKCCGSPLFLKDKFDSGYRLILTKHEKFNLDYLQIISKNTLGIELEIQSNIAREICLSIPNYYKHKLSKLLASIESGKQYLGVLNYGISSSTVEEVFLKYLFSKDL